MRTQTVCLLICLAALCPGSRAQSTFSTVRGSVRDTSGRVVVGATLKLTERDESTLLSASSNSQGLYEFLNVRPGRYEIRAEKFGFAIARAPDLHLPARQTLQTDFTLQIESRKDSALVVAIAPLIAADDGTISNSMNFEQITRLPVNYRALTTSPLAAILVFPGVQQDIGGRISIAGGLPAQTEFTIDGISALDVRGSGALRDLYPSSETISEFRVSSAGNKAEFGHLNDVTVTTKSGTNTPHGSLLLYHQNAALDAKTYGSPIKQAKVFNAFGGSFSGPIVLPHLYRGVNRTFFFVDHEGSRRPTSVPHQFTVPSAAMRAGNLNGVSGPAAIDPSTGVPFPGNVMPGDRINPVARALLTNYFPLPNYPGVINNYRTLTRQNTYADLYNIRLDRLIGARQQLFGRWSWNSATYPDDHYNILPPGQLPALNKSFIAVHTFAIRPNISNEARFGVSHFRLDQSYPLQGKQVIATLGLQGLDLTNAGNSGGFPYIDFSDGTGFPYTFKGRDAHDRSLTYQYSDALSWNRGRHTMKFGIELRRLSYARPLHGGDGADDFGGLSFYSNTFSGNAFADLLLGLPATSAYAALGPDISEVSKHFNFFAQDDWKVTSRLSLSIGLRWELHPPMREANLNLTNFQRSTGDVIIPDHAPPPAPAFLVGINVCPGLIPAIPCTKILTASQAGLPDTLRKTYYGNWDPRLGFAWRPFLATNTVVRGGAGIYTHVLLGSAAYEMTGIHTSDVRNFTNQTPDGSPLFRLPRISPGGLGDVRPGGEAFFDGTDPALKDPRVYQWNFTIERELPRNNLLRGSYIGSHATGLPVRANLNQAHASAVPLTQSRLPYPQWSYVYSFENLGFSSFEGLQLEASHSFRGGFFYQASYMLSKNLGLTNGSPSTFPQDFYQRPVTDTYNTRYDRGNLGGSRRQRILLTGLFPLPFGKGRHFGAHWSRLANLVAGGWELSTITMVESGPYATPTVGGRFDPSNAGTGFPRPDRIGNGNFDHHTRDRYWDASAFPRVPVGTGRYGNAGAGILEGPGTVAIAAGLAKTFSVTERLRLRVEGTFTNLPNHPNFLPPNPQITSPQFGRLTTVQSSENSGNRTGQVGARLEF